jgi:hypothetical protein
MSGYDGRRVETGNVQKYRYRKAIEDFQSDYISMLYGEGLKQNEIAEIMQLSPTRVRNLTPWKIGGLR